MKKHLLLVLALVLVAGCVGPTPDDDCITLEDRITGTQIVQAGDLEAVEAQGFTCKPYEVDTCKDSEVLQYQCGMFI